MTRRWPWVVAGGLIAAASTAIVLVANRERPLLPDLRPARPYGLAVSTVVGSDNEPTFWLGFSAAIENVGDGPLIIEGERESSEPTMAVTQVIMSSTGRSTRRPVAGTALQYEVGPDHAHWHYQAAIVYRLEHADGRPARAGTKTGFCLGDRYRLPGTPPPATPSRPQFTGFCGRGEPELTTLRQGISVFHGDDYPGFLEGQSLKLTGLPAGAYRLVHETDPDHLLAETDGGNNTAATTFTLAWPGGPGQPPTVTVTPTMEVQRPRNSRSPAAERLMIRSPGKVPPTEGRKVSGLRDHDSARHHQAPRRDHGRRSQPPAPVRSRGLAAIWSEVWRR